MLLSLSGLRVDLERWQSTGILDGVLELPDRVYLMEFKFARKGKVETLVADAMDAIARRGYAAGWTDEGKPVIAWGLGVAGKTLGWGSRAVAAKA